MRPSKSRLEESIAGNYRFASTHVECIQGYEFIVNSHYPKNASNTASEKLCLAIKPQTLRTLAKKSSKVIPSPMQMPCETLREGGRK